MKRYLAVGIFCLGLGLAINAVAKDEAPAKEAAARVGDAYSLDTCPVSGEKLGSMGDPVVLVNNGKEVRLCCAGCQKKYDANAETMDKDIDAKLMAAQEASYPAKTCINSGADLKDGGVSFIAGNRLFKTCCENCKAKVTADPAAFIAKLDKQVAEAQAADYKATTCPISGKPLGDAPVDVVVANKLVKLCCEGCKKGVDKDPAATLSKISSDS